MDFLKPVRTVASILDVVSKLEASTKDYLGATDCGFIKDGS